MPSTYQQACAGPASVGCLNTPPGPIPSALNQPLHFPVLRPGQRCPASPGRPVTIGDDTGTEQGNGSVRVLTGASRYGVANLLAHTNAPPWFGLKTTWFSVPAYQGPFVIRAKRLGRPRPGRPERAAAGDRAARGATRTDDHHRPTQQRAAGIPRGHHRIVGQVPGVLRLAVGTAGRSSEIIVIRAASR